MTVRANHITLRDLCQYAGLAVSAPANIEQFFLAWAVIKVYNVRRETSAAVGAGHLFQIVDQLPQLSALLGDLGVVHVRVCGVVSALCYTLLLRVAPTPSALAPTLAAEV